MFFGRLDSILLGIYVIVKQNTYSLYLRNLLLSGKAAVSNHMFILPKWFGDKFD